MDKFELKLSDDEILRLGKQMIDHHNGGVNDEDGVTLCVCTDCDTMCKFFIATSFFREVAVEQERKLAAQGLVGLLQDLGVVRVRQP